ncbi:Stress-activated map kinase-interacting protein 1 [Echinococcus multilocularis]|uniref:Stress-activated map kinase-interacting protein 1 n=1 Tax=Echinococcus multilocularis TaxID=6211 RepID=A0A0S4MK06_ECHMU|nr:Stress-activated map kinase-interacting protein 1 [Echinococcus multilocularis]
MRLLQTYLPWSRVKSDSLNWVEALFVLTNKFYLFPIYRNSTASIGCRRRSIKAARFVNQVLCDPLKYIRLAYGFPNFTL